MSQKSKRIAQALGALVAAVVAVLVLWPSGPGVRAQPPQQAVTAGRAAAEAVEEQEVADPVSITVPKIGAHSSLVPLGLNDDGTAEVPPVTRPLQAGWYTHGPKPGAVGPSVVLGHVDGNKQAGIFFRLRELGPGDTVDVARRDGSTAHFSVYKVDTVEKSRFPTDAVYGDTGGAELRLITCGGVFDKASRNYLSNVVVYARLG